VRGNATAAVIRFATQWELCGSGKGCVKALVAQGTPVQIYRQQGAWTCGYVSGKNGAGPAWIRTDVLRIYSPAENPSPNAWLGNWVGAEDHVTIRLGAQPGALHLVGNAMWQGNHTSHTGDMGGMVSPPGNHLHFVANGPGSCTIDLVLVDRYILAEDNNACGGLNARFQGLWQRSAEGIPSSH
jgi:hypothetical protein